MRVKKRLILLCLAVSCISFVACGAAPPSMIEAASETESSRGEFRDALESLSFRVDNIALTFWGAGIACRIHEF